jgi:hypothetical protein
LFWSVVVVVLRLATNQQIVVVQIQGTRGMKGACKDLEEGLEEQIVNSVYLNQNYRSLVGLMVIKANLIKGQATTAIREGWNHIMSDPRIRLNWW